MRYVLPGLLGLCLCAAVIPFGAVELHHAIYAYAIAAVLALIWAGKLLWARTPVWKPSPMHWPVLGFLLYTVIQYFLSPYEYLSRLELFQVALYGLVYFTAANNVNRGRERTIVLIILLVLGTAEAMYGIWQGYTRSDSALNVERPSEYIGRAGGSFICPNHLAGLLEMVLGFALARLAIYRPPDRESIEAQVVNKVMLAYAVIAIIAGILLTFSRSGWIATTIGLLLFLVWGGLKTRAMLPRLAAGLGALCVLSLLLYAIPQVRYYARLAVSPKDAESTLPLKDPSFNGRSLLWGASWKMIQDHPIFGTGAGTWQWVHQKYRDPRMQFTADYAHNDILQTASDYGIVGVALVVAVLVGFYRQARRLTIEGVTSEQRAFAVGAVAAVSILLVHSWFDFNLHIPANGLVFCTILGLVAGMEIPDGPYGVKPMNSLLRYGLVAALIATVIAGVYFVTPAAKAVSYTETGSMEKQYMHFDEAIAYFEAALRADPQYPRPHLKLGDLYSVQARFRVGEEKKEERTQLQQKAITHYTAAYNLNRSHGDVLSRLACVYEDVGEAEQARKAFEKAIELDPNNVGIHSRYALFLRRQGEEKEALRAFEIVQKLHGSEFTYWNLAELRQSVRAE